MSDEESIVNKPWNILPIADVMGPMVEKFGKMSEQAEKVSKAIDKKLARIEWEKCPIHGIELPVDRDSSFSESWWSKKATVIFGKCPLCLSEKSRILVNEKYREMGIPDRVMHATLDNYETEDNPAKIKALAKAKEQAQKKTGFLILRGNVGTGKTHLAAAILKMRGGLFVTEGDLVLELRNTYDKGGQEEMVRKYRTIKCLVIDELSREVKGTDIPLLLYRIFADRYDKNRETIITSNEPIGVIEEILGPRLTDRIRADCRIVTMEWASYRLQHA